MTPTAGWTIATTIAVISLIFGGGWLWKAYRRIAKLVRVDDDKDTFLLRSEFDAHLREEAMWRERMMEDFLEPLKDQGKALLSLSGSVERHSEALKYMEGALSELVRTGRKP